MYSKILYVLLAALFASSYTQAVIANDIAEELSNLQGNIDLVWVITAGALVFLMQAGFGLLESGMSRSKNAVNVILKNYMDLCVGSLIYFSVGYGLMFGVNTSGLVGMDHFFLSHASGSELGFAFFQTMFAATAVTIASGAMAERTQFVGYIAGAIFICAVIYPIYGSWVWGSFYEGAGWLSELGFIDFAGSTVVHSIGGWCALAGVLVLGPRLGRFKDNGEVSDIPAHNMMYVALGGFILWFGWFGFNAGSTLTGTSEIGLIAYNTQLAAAAGATGVLLLGVFTKAKILASRTINGSLAGLVGITAGCATMTPAYAILTGLIASVIFIAGENLLLRLKIDDVVGAVSVHGFCGVWGTLAAGLFYAEDPWNVHIITVQLLGIGAAFLWAFPLMYIVFYLIDHLIGLRASAHDERRGLDFSEHHEQGYPEFQQNILFNKDA
jgi:Amt family ammonium transporter